MSLGVCIETFWSDLDYLERIRRVKKAGYRNYEFWFPDKRFDGKGLHDEPKDFDAIAELNDRLGLTTTDFVLNHPGGGIQASLIDRADRAKLVDGFGRAAEMAKKIRCRALITAAGDTRPGQSRESATECMVGSLKALAPLAEKAGLTLLLEPFNSRVDHPGCFLDDPRASVAVVDAVGSPAVGLLYDIYHMQIMAGDVLSFLKENLGRVRHFHIAGVPGRHEPWPCELDYAFIVAQVRAMGYTGAFGLEYWPTVDSARSLALTRKRLGPDPR